MADTTETTDKGSKDEVKDEVKEAESEIKKDSQQAQETEDNVQATEASKPAEDIYDEELPDRIVVGRNHPISFYTERARRIFRTEEVISITGRGDNMSSVCKIVETLKRQRIATVTRVATGMNVVPYFNKYGDAKWGQPTAVILFVLNRGELAEYISDYQQRKIIEIFETNDEKQSGQLSVEKVNQLQLDQKFKANSKQCENAKQFLENVKDNNGLDLPGFIKYASHVIHPLLKNRVFKEILNQEFGIDVGGRNTAPKEP